MCGPRDRPANGMDYSVEKMRAEDWEAVRAIYLEGIATGLSTFETEAPPWEEWDRNHLPACRLVARTADRVIGWVALSPVSQRRVYAGVADESIYVAASARGTGVGTALLKAVIAESARAGIWSLQAGIFRENRSSIALHQRCGFREIGYQESKGMLHGVWHDVVLMERRSVVIGA